MDMSVDERQDLNKALGGLKKTLIEVKPKVLKIKDKMRAGEPLSEQQKEVISRYQRGLKLIKKCKDINWF